MSERLGGRLVSPPAYVLPYSQARSPDRLLELARRQAQRTVIDTLDGLFDPYEELSKDRIRFGEQDSMAWGLSRHSLPRVLAVCQIADGYRRFVAMPEQPWQVPPTMDFLLKGVGVRASRSPVVALSGETVEADLSALVFTKFLDLTSPTTADMGILRDHVSPRCFAQYARPEIFTFRSAFNNAFERWPWISTAEHLRALQFEERESLANLVLGYGLEMLAEEPSDKYVRLAARRLIHMSECGHINLHLTSNPYEMLKIEHALDLDSARDLLPEEHGLAYLSNRRDDSSGIMGTILVPNQWIEAAAKRPIVALAHLTRVASLARDDYFSLLHGSEFVFNRTLRAVGEIPRFRQALQRADGLTAKLIQEARQLDKRVYGMPMHLDGYCGQLGVLHHFSVYDDPPENGRSSLVPRL